MFNKYNQDNIDNESIESVDSDSDDELYDIINNKQRGGKIDEKTFKLDGFFNKNVDGIINIGINFWELLSIIMFITILLIIFLNNDKWNTIRYINKLYITGTLIFWGCVSCTNIIITILNEKYIIEGHNFFKIEKYQMVLLIIITLCSIFGIIQYFNPEINLWIANPYMYGLIIAIIEFSRILFSYFVYLMPNLEIQDNKITGEDSLPNMKYNGLYLIYCILFFISYAIIYFIPSGLNNYTINSYSYQEPIVYLIILIIANIFNDKNGNVISYLFITLCAIIYRINIGFQESSDNQLDDIEIPDKEVPYTTDNLERYEKIQQMKDDGLLDFSSIYEDAKNNNKIKEQQKQEQQNQEYKLKYKEMKEQEMKQELMNERKMKVEQQKQQEKQDKIKEKQINDTSDFINTLQSDDSDNKQNLQEDYKKIIDLNKTLNNKITDKMDNIKNNIDDIQESISSSSFESDNTMTDSSKQYNSYSDFNPDSDSDSNSYSEFKITKAKK